MLANNILKIQNVKQKRAKMHQGFITGTDRLAAVT